MRDVASLCVKTMQVRIASMHDTLNGVMAATPSSNRRYQWDSVVNFGRDVDQDHLSPLSQRPVFPGLQLKRKAAKVGRSSRSSQKP